MTAMYSKERTNIVGAGLLKYSKNLPRHSAGEDLRSKVKRGLGSRRSLGSRCALGCGALGGRWRGLRRTGRGRGLRCGSRRVHDGRVVLYRG